MKPGDVINRRYVVTDVLPPGGNSQNARVTADGNEFFLKCFTKPKYPFDEKLFDPKKIDQLRKVCGEFERRHVEIISLLDKPMLGGGNLVKPTDFFRERGLYYKIYPFLRPASNSAIARAGTDHKQLFIKTFLLSLRELHHRHIVHSDLKPDNVLVETRAVGPVAKLIDFDEAYISGQPPKRMGGDITYASPELGRMINGDGGAPEDMTLGSDMFSVGLVVHKIVTGELPAVSGADGADSHGDAVHRGGTLSFQRLTGFPTEFDALLRETVNLQPAQRPGVEDLLQTLGIKPVDGDRRGSRPTKESPPMVINMGRRVKSHD